MNILNELNNCLNRLNELDDIINSLNKQLSTIETKEQDLLHYIESYDKMNFFKAYYLLKELKKVRLERRTVKNNMEIVKVYLANIDKIKNKENRIFLIEKINKRNKDLNHPYKNRIYDDKDLQNIMGGKK